MPREDRFELEIKKLATILAKLMGFKEQGKKKEMDQLLNESLDEYFGISLKELVEKPEKNIQSYLTTQVTEAGKANFIAEALYALAEIEIDPIKANILFLRSALFSEHYTHLSKTINFETIFRNKNLKNDSE